MLQVRTFALEILILYNIVYDLDMSLIIHWQNFASLGGPGRPRSCCFYPKELQGEATIDTAIALAAGDRAVAELPTACAAIATLSKSSDSPQDRTELPWKCTHMQHITQRKVSFLLIHHDRLLQKSVSGRNQLFFFSSFSKSTHVVAVPVFACTAHVPAA